MVVVAAMAGLPVEELAPVVAGATGAVVVEAASGVTVVIGLCPEVVGHCF